MAESPPTSVSTPTAPPRDDASTAHLLRLPDDPHGWIFGLAWISDHWAIGVSYTDVRNAVELRPLSASGVAAPSHTLPLSDFPLALVDAAGSALPWVIVEQDDRDSGPRGRYVAHGFGGGEHVVLALPPSDPGIRESSTRHAWRGGATPRGAAAYTTSIVRPRTQAERDASRRSGGGRPGGSESGFVTLAHTARHYGGGAASFESARFKHGVGVSIGWREVAIGDEGWVGAHWISDAVVPGADRPVWNVELHWFDEGATRKRASRKVVAPAGSSGQLAMAADGTTYHHQRWHRSVRQRVAHRRLGVRHDRQAAG